MKKIVIVLALMVGIQLLLSAYFLLKPSDKIVYADAIRLFNEFKLKTDLERSSQPTLKKAQAALDSVGVIYKANPQNEDAQRLVMQKQQEFNDIYSQVNKTINDKVWERLNGLIHDFGEKENLQLLIGANGMGTLLYASDKKDMTNELIKFVNERYEKGN